MDVCAPPYLSFMYILIIILVFRLIVQYQFIRNTLQYIKHRHLEIRHSAFKNTQVWAYGERSKHENTYKERNKYHSYAELDSFVGFFSVDLNRN